ncbi:uncharacterized protein Dwil_GK18847 [Drosophila willistoni]|uniref:Odorant receptor n=2 Tax=Drosophila willistoni TaxID=7260 RepID=B4NE84_DROWI|nr:uncharacterized protein Dwil_GK18847 [Drosophila willistoni]
MDTHSGLKYHYRVWELTGLIQPEGMSRRRFLLYAIILNTFVTLFFPMTLLAKLFYTQSLPELCENLTITITDIAAGLKFLNVFLVLKELKKIRHLVKQLDARALEVNNEEELGVLDRGVRWSKNSFRIFAGIFVFGTCLSCLRVYLSKERTLLYPAWFGIDWRQSDSAYGIIFAYQFLGLVVQALQDCANDSYPPAFLCLLTAHMRVLELRIRRIGYEGHGSRGDAHAKLVECIQDFMQIHRLTNIIQQILSVTCMVQFACSAAVQCTVAMHFLFISGSNDLSAMALSLVFFAAVTLEIFIFCYFGDGLQAQSMALLNAFYSCNWMEQSLEFRRDLIIVMIRTQKVSYICAGGYIPLTLETFVQVMRFTYSAFTLLLKAV